MGRVGAPHESGAHQDAAESLHCHLLDMFAGFDATLRQDRVSGKLDRVETRSVDLRASSKIIAMPGLCTMSKLYSNKMLAQFLNMSESFRLMKRYVRALWSI